MKKLIVIVGVLFMFQASYGQIFTWGIKGGVNSTKLKFDDFSGSFNQDNPANTDIAFSPADPQMGFHLGVLARIKVLALYVQPELTFSSTGSKININDPLASAKTVATVKYNKLDIPVMVGMKFGPARVNLGPVATMNFSSKADVSAAYKNAVEDYTSVNKFMTWGAQIGAGVDILSKLTLDIRYEFGLSKLGESISIAGQDFGTDQRQNQFLASVGFLF